MRMRWRRSLPGSARGKAQKARTNIRLPEWIIPASSSTFPWCACCVHRRMTPADDTSADNPEWRPGDPGSIGARVDARRRTGEHWIVSLVTPETGYAVLRLMDYPSWRVTLDGQPVNSRPLREDGLMAVPVPAGSHVMEVQWTATRDVLAGRIVSAIALLGLAVVVAWERKERGHRRV